MTLKRFEAKKRHHHVWAHYLTRWGNGTNNVFYTTKNGKLAHDSVRALVVDDYFYKTTVLTSKDVEIIKCFSRKSPENLQQQHMSYLHDFLKAQNTEAIYLQSQVRNQEVEQHLHAVKCNLLENLHAAHENKVLHILAALADGKLDVLQDRQNMIEFMTFFGHQISRTKTFRDSVLQQQPNRNAMEIEVVESITRAWWFLSYIFGMNIGWSLFADRHASRHALLINDTNVPFITADHPIVNMHSCVSENKAIPPAHADFCYPISPKVAYIICESERFTSGTHAVDELIVAEINTKIASQAMVHIIGNSEDAIRPFQQYVGRRHQRALSWRVLHNSSDRRAIT